MREFRRMREKQRQRESKESGVAHPTTPREDRAHTRPIFPALIDDRPCLAWILLGGRACRDRVFERARFSHIGFVMDPSGVGFREASFLASWLWRAGILLEVGAAPPRPSSYPSFNLADIRAAVSTMSDHPQQPSNTSSAGQSDNAAPADARAQAGPAPPAARPLRGMASMRGAASLRGGLGRGASVSSSASMVPSRSSYASPAPGTAGSAGPGSGVRMQFRPVMPQRRKASASPAPTSSTAPESSTALASRHAGLHSRIDKRRWPRSRPRRRTTASSTDADDRIGTICSGTICASHRQKGRSHRARRIQPDSSTRLRLSKQQHYPEARP
ncbi:hypothetical protein L1887_51566 [Cichorium endivia]|nr:hypothetical protein L1887_51566 [Cichorium endivia]